MKTKRRKSKRAVKANRRSPVRSSAWLASIEREISEAYEIGYQHGSNPMREMNGNAPRRVEEGWGQCAKRLNEQLRAMLANVKLCEEGGK